jgi:hypothetical protein
MGGRVQKMIEDRFLALCYPSIGLGPAASALLRAGQSCKALETDLLNRSVHSRWTGR